MTIKYCNKFIARVSSILICSALVSSCAQGSKNDDDNTPTTIDSAGITGGTSTITPRPSTSTSPTPIPTVFGSSSSSSSSSGVSPVATTTPGSSPTATPRPGSATPTPTATPRPGPSLPPIATIGATSDSSGRARATFQITSSATKFLVVAESGGNSLSIESLTSSAGANYLPAGVSLASISFPEVKAANAPSRGTDPAISSGVTYTAVALASRPGATVNFTVLSNTDSDLQSGRLSLNLFRVGGTAQSSAGRAAISQALAAMGTILSSQAGISLSIREFDVAGPDTLPDPVAGSSIYRDASSLGASPGVNLFVAGDVNAGGGLVTAAAADIPGSPLPSSRSAAAVSLNAVVGDDGSYSAEAVKILGQRFAYVVAQYMGLFSVVEFSGSVAVFSDPIDDTPLCSTVSNCISNQSLLTNLMFPTPLDGVPDEELLGKQEKLTSQQRAVLNRYVAVDWRN